ncbi:MAG: phytase, partial [Thalassolituus oleivorans]|nr:phytase [Thalassolituus oleivorans]
NKDYPQGLLVVQDGRNLLPNEKQNFKYVSWHEIQSSLNL